MKNIRYTISALFTLVLGLSLFANDTIADTNLTSAKDSLRYVPFQYSFVPSMGSNGPLASQTVNNFSCNVLMGYQGGLDGFEIAGFSNMLKYDMHGTQIAGFSNSVFGKVDGTQFAGFMNTSKGYTEGIQLAGFGNMVNDSLKGFQGAGFSNAVNGKAEGLQLAGFSNLVKGEFDGAQAAGFSNIVNDTIDGIQLAGFSNIVHNGGAGAQFAGFANIAHGDFQGAQVSGFVNITGKLRGLQLGVVNICDTIEKGVAIGLVNIVRKGYYAFELGANESMYLNAAFKMGSRKFYNIITTGFTPQSGDFIVGFGYGAGTQIDMNEKWHTNLELIAYHINETDSNEASLVSEEMNMLTRFNLNFGYSMGSGKELFFGPSLNVMVSQIEKDGVVGSSLPPYVLYDFVGDYTAVQIWAGLNAGIRF